MPRKHGYKASDPRILCPLFSRRIAPPGRRNRSPTLAVYRRRVLLPPAISVSPATSSWLLSLPLRLAILTVPLLAPILQSNVEAELAGEETATGASDLHRAVVWELACKHGGHLRVHRDEPRVLVVSP